jgi:hypothetical protein
MMRRAAFMVGILASVMLLAVPVALATVRTVTFHDTQGYGRPAVSGTSTGEFKHYTHTATLSKTTSHVKDKVPGRHTISFYVSLEYRCGTSSYLHYKNGATVKVVMRYGTTHTVTVPSVSISCGSSRMHPVNAEVLASGWDSNHHFYLSSAYYY